MLISFPSNFASVQSDTVFEAALGTLRESVRWYLHKEWSDLHIFGG
jgi:hypothetical protein